MPKGHKGFVKGMKRPVKAGRRAGTPNKDTADVRHTIKLIAERKVIELERWLERVAVKDPGKAADLYLKTIEYHIPKLQRTEMTGLDGGSIVIESTPSDEKL